MNYGVADRFYFNIPTFYLKESIIGLMQIVEILIRCIMTCDLGVYPQSMPFLYDVGH